MAMGRVRTTGRSFVLTRERRQATLLAAEKTICPSALE
jgi:hypothetical protein